MLAAVRPEERARAAVFEGVRPVTLLELIEIPEEHDAGRLAALAALPR